MKPVISNQLKQRLRFYPGQGSKENEGTEHVLSFLTTGNLQCNDPEFGI
jgi:hypothetical protein